MVEIFFTIYGENTVARMVPFKVGSKLWNSMSFMFQAMPTVMLAGEATSDNYFSTTHGAYDTGVKQAQIFLRHHVFRR